MSNCVSTKSVDEQDPGTVPGGQGITFGTAIVKMSKVKPLIDRNPTPPKYGWLPGANDGCCAATKSFIVPVVTFGSPNIGSEGPPRVHVFGVDGGQLSGAEVVKKLIHGPPGPAPAPFTSTDRLPPLNTPPTPRRIIVAAATRDITKTDAV